MFASIIAAAMFAAFQVGAQPSQSSQKVPDPPLLNVHRVYVDSFGDSEPARQIQAMVISALARTNRFKVTENRENADAVLKGSATELSSKELHASSEETSQAVVAAGGSGSATSSTAVATASGVGVSTSEQDASLNTETIYNARLSVRLVDARGDVIWATSEDTLGSKYKTATADLADKTVAQLLRDVTRTETGASLGSPINPTQVLRTAKSILVVVSGDKAMEAEVNAKLLKWGKLALVSASGHADLTLEITQTGKFNAMRYGSAVTAGAVLRDSETATVLWSSTKGGVWSMSGASTRHVGRQIADELIKFLNASQVGDAVAPVK